MNKVIVDKARLLRRAIFISWATLALCFIIKIFGGNFFEIMCDNPNYNALCEYADSHFWCKFVLGFLSSMICQTFYILAILQKYKYSIKEFLLTIFSVEISCFVKLFNSSVGIILDVWVFVGLPMLLLGSDWKKYSRIAIALLLTWSFQIVSLLVRNLSLTIIDNSTFISLIYMIDVYIMCALYYLYVNYEKENKSMGIFWGWFAGKPADKLKAMKEKREAKIKKLEAEKNAIELELSKRKNEK